MKISKGDMTFDIVNTVLVTLITLIMIYPLYFIIIASFSDPVLVSTGKVAFLPKGATLDAYRNVFMNNSVWRGYRNTFFYTTAGTLYNLVLTIPAAYVISKKYLPMRNVFSWFFFITMYFGGGLIPTYILMSNLHLTNKPIVMVIGTGISCYNLIVTRSFFSASVPGELFEAAKIDGADEYASFFRIALPLAKPIIAIMALYYGVGHWNSYYSALVYLQDAEYFPLQLVLRNILLLNEGSVGALEYIDDTDALAEMAKRVYMANAMKYALIFISSAPLLIAYPFVQKFFVKGALIGAVKG